MCILRSAESGTHSCVLRHLRRCSHSSQLSVSRFPVNRQCFRTYHLLQITRILPAFSGAFGASRCAAYLYSGFLGTVFGESVCVCYLCSCVFLRRCVVCSWVCYLCSSCVFLGDVWCVCYLYRFRVFLGEKKMVQRNVEVVADYEDRVNLTASSAPATWCSCRSSSSTCYSCYRYSRIWRLELQDIFFFNDLTLL